VSDTGRTLAVVLAVAGCAAWAGATAWAAPSAESWEDAFALSIHRGATVAIRRAPASGTLALARWKTSFGSVRRLRVVERRGNWFSVESDVLGNGVVGWVPRTAAVRLEHIRYSVEADLSDRIVTLRAGAEVVFRRRVSIGANDSPTPSGRFHVTDQISGRRWGLGCCIVVLSGTQPRLPTGWSGGGRLAIHGVSDDSERIGAPVTAGCLHATEETLRVLSHLPLGTPVVVHP
jgi:lipoprotein-anchoring transpeptidase ErfK/SrfK